MDKIIRCITSDGSIMACAIDSTIISATAQQVHGLSPVATAALGRLLTASSMMGVQLKQSKAAVTVRIDGGGPIGSLVAVATGDGNCRGYCTHPDCPTEHYENGKLNVSQAVGKDGTISVIRDYGTGTPYHGRVALQSGEIAEDITAYYAVSEQIPTVCALGVLVDKANGDLMLSGGMLIQLLPGADDSTISKLEQNISTLEPVTTMLAKGMTIKEMCETALNGFEVEVLEETPVNYVCSCSKERVLRALSTMSDSELQELPDENGSTELVCSFCNKKYQISREDIEQLIKARADKSKE